MQRPQNSAFGNLTKVQRPHSFLQASVPAPKCTRQVSTNGARTHIDKNYLPSREIKRGSTASSVPSVKAWRSVQSPKIIVCFSRPFSQPTIISPKQLADIYYKQLQTDRETVGNRLDPVKSLQKTPRIWTIKWRAELSRRLETCLCQLLNSEDLGGKSQL